MAIEDVLGENIPERLYKLSEDLLRKAYHVNTDPIATDDYTCFNRGIGIDKENPDEVYVIALMRQSGFFKMAHEGLTITDKGKEVFDTYFRKEGETLGKMDELSQLVKGRKAEEKKEAKEQLGAIPLSGATLFTLKKGIEEKKR